LRSFFASNPTKTQKNKKCPGEEPGALYLLLN
jgi:hypothetical protein